MKQKRKPTRIHTRKIDRMVAKKNMKKQGMVRTCKHRVGNLAFSSEFSVMWRDYA